MSDDPLEQCPECQTPSLKRKIGLGAGIIFKGGGFYETDFKDRKGTSSESASSGKSDSTEKKAESATADKPAASSSAKPAE